jgi:hypothetical protein
VSGARIKAISKLTPQTGHLFTAALDPVPILAPLLDRARLLDVSIPESRCLRNEQLNELRSPKTLSLIQWL